MISNIESTKEIRKKVEFLSMRTSKSKETMTPWESGNYSINVPGIDGTIGVCEPNSELEKRRYSKTPRISTTIETSVGNGISPDHINFFEKLIKNKKPRVQLLHNSKSDRLAIPTNNLCNSILKLEKEIQ